MPVTVSFATLQNELSFQFHGQVALHRHTPTCCWGAPLVFMAWNKLLVSLSNTTEKGESYQYKAKHSLRPYCNAFSTNVLFFSVGET